MNINTNLFTNPSHEPHQSNNHHQREIDLIHISVSNPHTSLDLDAIDEWLAQLDKECIYRVKGIVNGCRRNVVNTTNDSTQLWVLNCAFGRSEWTLIDPSLHSHLSLSLRGKITVMGVGLGYAVRYPLVYNVFGGDAIVDYSPAKSN